MQREVEASTIENPKFQEPETIDFVLSSTERKWAAEMG